MRRFLAGLAAALLWFGQADAVPAFWSTYPAGGIGYVGSLFNNGGNDSDCKGSPFNHNSATTGKSVPAGALILVWTVSPASERVTAVNDTVGNTYNSLLGDTDSDSYQVQLWYSVNSTALPSGDSISLTPSNLSSGPCRFIASAFTGIVLTSPLDQSGTTTNTGTAPSLSSGTLNDSLELVTAATWVNGGGSDSFTEAPGFTTDTTLTGSANGFNSAYKIVHSTASTTYAPTLGTSRVWNALMGTFIGVQ